MSPVLKTQWMKLEREERSLMSSWVPSAAIKDPDTRTEGSRKPGGVRDFKRGCNTGKKPYLQGGSQMLPWAPGNACFPRSEICRSRAFLPYVLSLLFYYLFLSVSQKPGKLDLAWGFCVHVCTHVCLKDILFTHKSKRAIHVSTINCFKRINYSDGVGHN